MGQLARYCARFVVGAILIVLLIIVAIDSIGALVEGLGDMRNDFTYNEVLIHVVLTMPARVYEYIPLSSLIGCLLGLGVLANNSELAVMRASGVSILQIIVFILQPVLLLIAVAMLLGEFIVPFTEQLAESRKMYMRNGQEVQELDSGIWNREGNEFMHFNAVYPGGVLFGVSRYSFDHEQRLQQASFAERATYQQGGYWLEEKGQVTTFLSERALVSSFNTRKWQSTINPELLKLVVVRPESLGLRDLDDYVKYLASEQRDTSKYELAFWSKALQPLTIAGLVLVAISFVFGPLRNATMGYRVFAGVVAGVVFRTGQDMLGPASLVFGFSPLVAVLAPALVVTLLGLILLRRVA